MMNIYTNFDYLANTPFYIPDIGRVKCPTLKEVRDVTYNNFSAFSSIILLDLKEYLESRGLEEGYSILSEGEKDFSTLFNFYLLTETEFFITALQFFFYDIPKIEKETLSVVIYDRNNPDKVIGIIDAENFDTLRKELRKILGFKKKGEEIENLKFKNERAREIYYKIHAHHEEMEKDKAEKSGVNMELDNMILKYCTYNKVGINLLNVWDLTYYQFNKIFAEFQMSRSIDHADRVAANTFTYEDASDYDYMAYMKKIE